MDFEILLERMATISPSARLHLTGQLWQVNIDPDEITQQLLVNTCFSEIISEAYELGIEFYCSLSDLCQSTYILDKVLLLLEVVFPSPLYKSLLEDESFKTFIKSAIEGGATYNGETTILTILEYLALYNEKTTDIFYDTYVFLHDKMQSTPIFNNYVQSILDVDNIPVSVPTDENIINEYTNLIQDQFNRLLEGADLLFSNLTQKDKLIFVYDAINNYKITACMQDTLMQYSWAYTVSGEELTIPLAQVLKTKYLTLFKASVPFFEEYFLMRDLPILTEHLYTLVLGVFLESTTKAAFFANVKDVFARLIAKGRKFDNDSTLFIQKLILAITQDYKA